MPKQNKMMQMVHSRLRLTLVDGRTLVGQLLAYDKHLNLVLADCEESRVPRKAAGKSGAPEMRRTLGLVMLRGEQVVSMSPEGVPAANRTRVPASQVMSRAAGMVPPPGAPVGMAAPVPPGMYMPPGVAGGMSMGPPQ